MYDLTGKRLLTPDLTGTWLGLKMTLLNSWLNLTWLKHLYFLWMTGLDLTHASFTNDLTWAKKPASPISASFNPVCHYVSTLVECSIFYEYLWSTVTLIEISEKRVKENWNRIDLTDFHRWLNIVFFEKKLPDGQNHSEKNKGGLQNPPKKVL